MNDKTIIDMEGETMENKNWIPVSDRLPEEGQDVAFIVESSDEYYNGRRLGGRYQGYRFGYHEFSTPGHGWQGSYWMPLPEPPKQ